MLPRTAAANPRRGVGMGMPFCQQMWATHDLHTGPFGMFTPQHAAHTAGSVQMPVVAFGWQSGVTGGAVPFVVVPSVPASTLYLSLFLP